MFLEWQRDTPDDQNTSHIYSIYPDDDEYGIWDCVAKSGTGINYLLSKKKWISNILIYEWISDCVCGHNRSIGTKNVTPRIYIEARDAEMIKKPEYNLKLVKKWAHRHHKYTNLNCLSPIASQRAIDHQHQKESLKISEMRHSIIEDKNIKLYEQRMRDEVITKLRNGYLKNQSNTLREI